MEHPRHNRQHLAAEAAPAHTLLALPLWATAGLLAQRIGVPRRFLAELTQRGFVRAVKLGDSRQSGRLFRSEDVLAALDRLAAGAQPRRRVRAATPTVSGSEAGSHHHIAGSDTGDHTLRSSNHEVQTNE